MVLGMKVLESKETPGLGDKIEKDADFVAEFAGVATPLVGVKSGKSTGAPGEVDMITGATISAQAIVDIINNRLDALADPLAGLAGTALAGTAAGTASAPATSGGTP
jgi:Na+-translocating ferredoxin:NAD+ oxidoreductase RnfG subunit